MTDAKHLPPEPAIRQERPLPDQLPAVLFQDTPNLHAYLYPGATLATLELSAGQAKNILRRAVLKPGRPQLLFAQDPEKNETIACVRLKNAPGGRVLLHPEDADTPLAAALGSSLERLGCLHKLGIAPAPFNGGVPDLPRRKQ